MSATLERPTVRTGLETAASQAHERALCSGAPVLLSWTARIRPSADPVAFFALADARAPRTLWMDGPTGFALAGAGEALAPMAEDGDRFAAVSAALKAARRGAVAAAEEGLEPVGAVAIGGFAFAPGRPADEEWQGFPPAAMAT